MKFLEKKNEKEIAKKKAELASFVQAKIKTSLPVNKNKTIFDDKDEKSDKTTKDKKTAIDKKKSKKKEMKMKVQAKEEDSDDNDNDNDEKEENMEDIDFENSSDSEEELVHKPPAELEVRLLSNVLRYLWAE